MSQPGNPLLSIRVPVPWGEVRADHIEKAIEQLLVSSQSKLDAIGDPKTPRTYESTLGALDLATGELDFAMNVAGHLEAVLGTPELRDAYNAVLSPVTAFYSKIVLSEPLYKALLDLAATDEAKGLDPARARYLKKTLDDFRRNGAELDAKGKKRLAEIDVALAQKTQEFAQNVVDATAAFELVVEDVSRLSGLPEGALEAAKKSAEERGKKGYRLTLQAPSSGPVMTFADDRGLRETIYRANVTRASRTNPGLVREVLELRREKASLLGFSHFADLATDDRMAKSGKKALDFVNMLRERLLPGFERENAELLAFARKNGHEGELEPWDTAYWAEKQRRALYDFDEETLRPYHPLDRVLRGLFEIASKLYGITIERLPEAKVWHRDVTAWSVKDEDGKRIGRFYLDLFPRETK
ncbi:MAG TPA: M3 family metallopeptidase, partial [Planctomycetota bacterium]|nr:M3 family metallopeptidase [Planctomycetota bacterium]